MYRKMICIGPYTDEQIISIKEAGFEQVELSFSKLAAMTDEQVREYLDMLDSLGFKYVAANGFFGTGVNCFFDGSFDVRQVREYVSMAFEKTRMIKWESIAFGSGFMRKVPDGYPMDEAYEFMAQLLKEEIAPFLEKYDAYLNVEELNSGETNFINSCAEAAKLVKLVNHPRIGILCDFYHMSLAGETHEDLPQFAEHIGHVHIASPSNGRVFPYESDGDNEKYRAFLNALKDTGYKNGYISIESVIPDGLDFASAAKKAGNYLQKELDIINARV